jgi:predicted transcriptional regulator
MTRTELHELVEGIPDSQIDLVAAFLHETTLAIDDEPLTEIEQAGLRQGLADMAAGHVRPLKDVLSDQP